MSHDLAVVLAERQRANKKGAPETGPLQDPDQGAYETALGPDAPLRERGAK